MKLKTKIAIWGWMMNVVIVFSLFYYGYPWGETSYLNQDRINMDKLFSAEYEARLPDIQRNITPLSVADLGENQ